MTSLHYHAEKVTDYGNITGDGLGNLLGAPKLEPLELLVREAVQNSWDARREDADAIEFGVEYKTLRDRPLRTLQDSILHSHPPKLDGLTHEPELPVLLVWDRNTRGLAGPVRPTETAGGRRDFVNFVYMIGETKPSTDHQGTVSGGSYGYGRSSFFRASRARTILVHSRTEVGGELESRFVGVSWLDKYRDPRTDEQCTGRHWWGEDRDGWVGPVIGESADAIAKALGMPVPGKAETGTTIMVLDPAMSSVEADGESDKRSKKERAATPKEQIVSSILWNCWPRMLAGGIKFAVRWEGQDVRIPDPRHHSRLKAFTRAFDTLRGRRDESQMARTFEIRSKSPKALLGRLGLARRAFARMRATPDPSSPVSPEEPLRHVALMRNTLMVLKYMQPSGIPPREGEQYAGVFVTDRDIEDVFARAEPPSHDDWVRERLSDRNERIYVNVSFTRIDEKTRKFVAPTTDLVTSAYTKSVAGLADHLGGLLPGLNESARGKETISSNGGGGGGTREKKPQIQVKPPVRRPGTNEVELEVPFSVGHLDNTEGSEITFQVSVVTAGGAKESAPPEGGRKPVVKSWVVGDAVAQQPKGDASEITLTIPPDVEDGVVTVVQPADCMVDIDLSAEGIAKAE
ncbi:hypothetical protein FIV42_15480 [Persicimonas caeni]|uniref:Uncharacterized protein n=1 Tax=Persicimonas caeni TaxID=2292766 RepID=A0A4Y6PV18_PERCE|nr:hypothetical protein [Persicimonas caeni]QDG52093.1 hypothetical protein FIV42_15480 [Persicimonas caeni]QED33314.1 hypothetical protein FRD00_15475 [Persicimonas caeni]